MSDQAAKALQKAAHAVLEERSARARAIWLSSEAVRLAVEAAEKNGKDPEAARQEVLDALGGTLIFLKGGGSHA